MKVSSKKSFRNKYLLDNSEEDDGITSRRKVQEKRRPIRNWTKIVEDNLDDPEMLEEIYDD